MRLLQCSFKAWLLIASVTLEAVLGSYVLPQNETEDQRVLENKDPHIFKRGLSGNVVLRTMCLGASIVYGYPAPDGNGFRQMLRNKLVWGGNPVNMVGSYQAGSMPDNDVEAQGGLRIDQVSVLADKTIPLKPNLILIYVGNNDIAQNFDIPNAAARLGTMVDKLFAQIPGVTIVVSTLLPNRNDPANVKAVNQQMPSMVASRQNAGKKIVLADMSSSLFSLADISSDGLHPAQSGFEKMAAVFYQAIEAASNKNWLTPPANTGQSDVVVNNQCDKTPGQAIGPYQIVSASGWSDGQYEHADAAVAGYLGVGNPAPEGVYWADIDGDGVDDYVYVSQNLFQGLGVALNQGNGNMGPYLRVQSGPTCLRQEVRFADMTGDGRADLCCLNPNGDLFCWQNTPGSDPRAPNWVSTGQLMGNSGFTKDQVRLADIDGDGRADYVGISADGSSVRGWRNTAVDNTQPSEWTPFGVVASGLPAGKSLKGWNFVDLNGDNRADMVHVSDVGEVTAWINQRALNVGYTPNWAPAGVTYRGPPGSGPITVTWGKFMGTGRADYSVITGNTATGNVWATRTQNLGRKGTALPGDGVRYCDMSGDGSDDYIWISLNGEVRLWVNNHKWGEFTDMGVIINLSRTRREVYFADFDGDKKCDILLVDKSTGATTVLRNNYSGGTYTFTNLGVVTGSAVCTTGYGSELRDLGVRWHDMDRDGRADFLCMQRNGALSGYFNKGVNQMVWAGQMKQADGYERKDLRIADINGDGYPDLLYLDRASSATTAFHNNGPTGQVGDAGAGTLALRWVPKGIVATGGSGRGSAVEFANVNGVGRADYIFDPQTGVQNAMLNICPSGTETPSQPDLPTPPPMTWPLSQSVVAVIREVIGEVEIGRRRTDGRERKAQGY